MDSDQEDYVFCGTPIEREEEVTTRKKKAVAEASGNLRSLPSWKQEVTDEEGRRRFHGAFTGGFSAGYYNTVGSKEGWAPQTFTSSRKNRADVKQQNILNFLDEDEKAELEGQSFKTSMQFDTFGFTSAELARKQAEKEQRQRPSAIPGPVPDELILPATESIGVKLLLKMGWRHGHSIKDSHASSQYDARREARKAFLAFSSDDAKTTTDDEPVKNDLESLGQLPTNDDVRSSQSTPVYVLNPKKDLHGLGFDPFKHAPEFREKKRSRVSGGAPVKDSLFGFKLGKAAPGFGIGALEEHDAEDEDVYSTSYEIDGTHVLEEEEEEEPPRMIMDNKKRLTGKERDVLFGFKIASNLDCQLERFDPPLIPKDFIPQHKFPGPKEDDKKVSDPPPLEVSPPEDTNLKVLIEGVATLVARCGKLFEDLSREKNQSNPLFNFLTGGTGSDYYARKLWEECQKHKDQTKLPLVGKLSSDVQKMTAESRGKILGERPLERNSKDTSSFVPSADLAHLQVNLKDTFRKPVSFDELPEVSKPFTSDPAKQERFERFLKEKYEGGLRSTSSGGASNMSESDRARERLDFESAAEAIEKGKWAGDNKLSAPQFMEFAAAGGTKFTSGGFEQVKDVQAEDLMMKKIYPKREEFQWRPAPVLCKRFDLTDPYMGKPPPAPRMRSKMDSLIFMPDSVKATKVEETGAGSIDSFSTLQSDNQEPRKDDGKEVEVENFERPVDLYKAIFSDDSDDEAEIPSLDKVENPEKKAEVANTTLNRLIAGDFLESLGKELGLEVPPEVPSSMSKAETLAHKENTNMNLGNAKSETHPSPGRQHHQGIAQSLGNEKSIKAGLSESGSSKANKEDVGQEDRKSKVQTNRNHDLSSSSSSEDERSRKSSRRHHRHKSSDSDSDSSSKYRDRSRSKGRKKGSSSTEKSSRKSSKSHRHRRRDSKSRSSHHGRDKESETKREKRKWRD